MFCYHIVSIKESIEISVKDKKAVNDNLLHSIPAIWLKFLNITERVIVWGDCSRELFKCIIKNYLIEYSLYCSAEHRESKMSSIRNQNIPEDDQALIESTQCVLLSFKF